MAQVDVREVSPTFKFVVNDLTKFRRFLILGVESASYGRSEVEVGVEHAQALRRLLDSGRGLECVALVSELAAQGRCAKQNPMVFALALMARFGPLEVRKAVYAALPTVCSIPTTFFAFLEFCKSLHAGSSRGWGRLHRQGVASWYNSQEATRLAVSLSKYRNRKGWRHKDVLRLAHVRPSDDSHAMCLAYAAHDSSKGLAQMAVERAKKAMSGAPQGEEAAASVLATGTEDLGPQPTVAVDVSEGDGAQAAALTGTPQALLSFLEATDTARRSTDTAQLVQLITTHRLVREHVATTMLDQPPVWRALLPRMPLMALIRNLNKMTAIGLLGTNDGGQQEAVGLVLAKLADQAMLQRARIHPFNVLLALRTYQRGQGDKGSLRWEPVPAIVQALEAAFYASFKHVVPSGKRVVVALDVSGSMCSLMQGSCLSSREAVSAIAMTFMRTEEHCRIMGFSNEFIELPFTRESTLDDVMEYTRGLPFDATQCSLPMIWAQQQGVLADAFIVMTDNETNCDRIPPARALRDYRAATGIDARLVVVATAATGFTVADPDDGGMLDVAGLDSAAPGLVSEFIAGKV